jgi:all-trans-retinol 13,14-reductase
VHYIGDVGKQTMTKTLVDQITDGQLEWAPLEDAYDVVSIGVGEENRRYPVATGGENWKALLKKQFPDDHKGIDEYFRLMSEVGKASSVNMMLKQLPLSVSWLMINMGVVYLLEKYYGGKYEKNTLEIISDLTDNKDLRSVMCYPWGDIGSPPSQTSFSLQTSISRYYAKLGAHYPVGGASEFAFNMVPVVERAGGKVLCRANIEKILHNGKKVMGVRVRKGTTDLTYDIEAPIIISSAGLHNTFKRLLPQEVANKSYFSKLVSDLKPSWGTMSAFVGLNASNEELKLKAQNCWAFSKDDCGESFVEYMDSPREEALTMQPPLCFISFPSAKDPNWDKNPSRKGKSTCTIISGASWNWFKQFEGTTLHKRGDEYEEIKAALGENMIDMACKIYPQIRHHIDYLEFSSPSTNNFYWGQQHGETYGMDHEKKRFDDPWIVARLRPDTDIPGLYLTGQDILSAGVTPSLYCGALTAGVILGRNVVKDLAMLHMNLKKQSKAKKD